MSTADYKAICAASNAFRDYLVEHYRVRLEEPLPLDRRPLLALAVCQDGGGNWSVCLPLDLDDDDIKEWLDLGGEDVTTRGELMEFMDSHAWKGFLRWVAEVDEDGNSAVEEDGQ